MKIVSLIDNICGPCPATEHGLSLYVELDCGARILFDTGQGSLFAENASALGVDISSVDIAVISHGHYDHAGGLAAFLEINDKAPVYVRTGAFGSRFSVKEHALKQIGVNRPENSSVCYQGAFRDVSGRIVYCGEVESLPFGITLFSNPPADFPEPPGNRLLLGPDGLTPDDFCHEQSMLVTENGHSVLFGGCAHRGIANILARAGSLAPCPVTAVFSGMHISSIFSGASAPSDGDCAISDVASGPYHSENHPPYVRALATSLLSHKNVRYWTMHCTGEEGFRHLSQLMGERISYLTCGVSVEIH